MEFHYQKKQLQKIARTYGFELNGIKVRPSILPQSKPSLSPSEQLLFSIWNDPDKIIVCPDVISKKDLSFLLFKDQFILFFRMIQDSATIHLLNFDLDGITKILLGFLGIEDTVVYPNGFSTVLTREEASSLGGGTEEERAIWASRIGCSTEELQTYLEREQTPTSLVVENYRMDTESVFQIDYTGFRLMLLGTTGEMIRMAVGGTKEIVEIILGV